MNGATMPGEQMIKTNQRTPIGEVMSAFLVVSRLWRWFTHHTCLFDCMAQVHCTLLHMLDVACNAPSAVTDAAATRC